MMLLPNTDWCSYSISADDVHNVVAEMCGHTPLFVALALGVTFTLWNDSHKAEKTSQGLLHSALYQLTDLVTECPP